MTATDVKRYIRFIADRRLNQLGLQPIYRAGRQEPAALDGPDAGRHRAHQLLREPLDGVLQGFDQGPWEEAFYLGNLLRFRRHLCNWDVG